MREGMSMDSIQLIYLITTLAAAIAEGRTVDEITTIGLSLTQLADTLITIANQRGLCDNKNNPFQN